MVGQETCIWVLALIPVNRMALWASVDVLHSERVGKDNPSSN